MSTADAVLLTVMVAILFVILAYHAGKAVAAQRSEEAFRKLRERSAEAVVTDANSEGQLASRWKDSTKGDAIFEVPSCTTRQASRELAGRILKAQGEEGAVVAREVLKARDLDLVRGRDA